LTFDGSDDYVVVADDDSLDIPGALTLAFWTRYTSSGSGWIISKGTTGTAYGYWAAKNAGQIRFGDNAGFKTTTASTYNDGAWHFVVCVYDGGSSFDSLKIYVDNVEQTTTQAGSFSSFDATDEPLVLGGHFDSGSINTGRFFAGDIDNAMIFDKALASEEREFLYNEGNGTEDMSVGGYGSAFYTCNGWYFDAAEDFEVKVDFHYSNTDGTGWVEMALENNIDNYVSLSADYNDGGAHFYYEQVVDGNMVSSQVTRALQDGTLYISYDSVLDELYLSFSDYGPGDAWQTISGLLAGQWSSSAVGVSLGGGSPGTIISEGEAYLDDFEVSSGVLVGWPPVTDLYEDGYIDLFDLWIIAENWLESDVGVEGGDINDNGEADGTVDLRDLAELGLAW